MVRAALFRFGAGVAVLELVAVTAIGALEPLQRDTQTKALVQDALDMKGTTLTLGSLIVSDSAGIRVWDLGSTNGTRIGDTGDKISFLGATPIVRPSSTTDLRQALINLGLYTTGGVSPLNLNGGAFTAAAITGTTGTFTSTMAITGNTTVGGTLGVIGAITGPSLSLSGNALVGGTLGVTGVTTLAGLSGTTATFSSTLNATGNTTLGGTLAITGLTSGSAFSFTGNGNVGGTLGITGLLSGSAFSFIGNGIVGGTLGVTGTSTLSTVNATNANFSETLNVTGDSDFTNAVFDGTLETTGNTILGGTLDVDGNTDLAGNLSVIGPLTATTGAFSSTLGVTGNTTLGGTLSIGGHTNTNGFRVKNVGAQAVKLVDHLPDNAVQNASVNYATQLNTAIAAAQAGTRILELPEWPIRIDTTITISSSVLIIGKGGYGPVSTAPNASRLVWGGAAGGTMMIVNSEHMFGGGLESVTLDGNSLAASCLVVYESSWGRYDYCSFINFTTGDGIKVQGGNSVPDRQTSFNIFTNPYVDGLSGINQNGHSCIYLTGLQGNACWNKFISPTVFHGGNRPGWYLGHSDNNVIISPFTQRQPGGTGAGFGVDPTETVGFPSGYLIFHMHAGDGGWVQPASTTTSPGFIYGYNQDNGAPDPVTLGTPLYWTDNAGNFHGGKVNGLTIIPDGSGARLDLGLAVTGNKLDLYHSGNTHYGFGIAANELRNFVPTGAHFSFGAMSTIDGATFTEGLRIFATGGLNLGGATDPGLGNLSMAGSIKVSTAISARAHSSIDVSIPNSVATAVTFNSERWDYDNIHSTSTDTSRMTCVTPGIYAVVANASFDVNATGNRQIYLRVNGSVIIGVGNVANGLSIQETDLNVSTTYLFSAGDYVELIASQTSGGALSLKSHTAYTPELTMTRQP